MLKKTIIIIACIFIFLIIYFLQSNFFNWFNIAGVKPSLYIVFVLYIGLFMGRRIAAPFGMFFGLILDMLSGQVIGIYTIMLGIIGIAAGYADKKFSKESKITIILCVIVLTILYELGIFAIHKLLLESVLEINFFLKTVTIEALFNAILLIIFYPILKKLGYYVEDIFKGNNILTRYF